MNQKGFATLEVILMIVVIGILATVAVPRFTDMTTKANTAKIQSDLATLDNAIAIYYMDKGSYPSSIKDDLKNYIKDVDNLKPPTGKAYVNNNGTVTATDFTGKTYEITQPSGDETEARATLDSKTSGSFALPKNN